MFKSGTEPSSYVVQFADMSLHLITGTSVQWSREEGLSGIKQVEIIDNHAGSLKMEHEFEYIKDWNAPASSVPTRIMQRYSENLAYLAKYLFSTNSISMEEKRIKNSQNDIYGFQRTIIALTEFGKVLGISSKDGSVIWASNYFKQAPV